jgi:hypothetical protein
MRDTEVARLWWIDALSINQDDIEERSLQVLRMTAIYRTAFRVVAWIGPQNPGQPTLDQFLQSQKGILQRQLQKKPRKRIETDAQSIPDIAQLHDLLSREYWRRIWIVQELSVATEVWFVCGNSWVTWDHLCDIIDLYDQVQRKHSLSGADSKFKNLAVSGSPSWSLMALDRDSLRISLDAIRTLTAPAPLQPFAQEGLARSYEALKTLIYFRTKLFEQKPITIFEALKKTSSCLATDARDKIYALLGFVHDGRAYVPTPDYRICIDELMIQMTHNILRATKTLDYILAGRHETISTRSLPSWVPDWFDLGIEADYVFRQKSRDKFRASSDSLWSPSINGRGSAYILAESLIFAMIEGLSTTYGDLMSADDELLVQPQVDSLTSFGYKQTARDIAWCLVKASSFEVKGPYQSTDEMPYQPDSQNNSIYKRLIAAFRFKRIYSVPTFDNWLHENRDWHICKTKTLQDMFRPKAFKIQAIFNIFFICPTSRLGFFCLGLIMIGLFTAFVGLPFWFYNVPGHIITDGKWTVIYALIFALVELYILSWFLVCLVVLGAQQLRSTGLIIRVDKNMKQRHLKLAITAAGAAFDRKYHGAICLVPGIAKQGDYIAILKSCSTPVVLREYRDGYQVVGICCLRQAMYGSLMGSRSERWKEFKLY